MDIDINRLLQISDELGFKEISNRLSKIAKKQKAADCPLVLPLVGEFSSGKTTLINSLTDSKALETATKPTTATIFEVHFGAAKSKAIVLDDNGQSTEVTDIAALKNSELGSKPVVTVFDTSTKVPSSIVLVDTPGLSSPDPRHRQTLIDFLPSADAVLLVADINAQLTRSLTEFVKTMSLTKKRLFLVLTKTDTKSKSEVEASRKYIEDNLHVGKNNIVCVSAEKSDIGELLNLFGTIQKDKAQILEKVNEQRISMIVKEMLARIDKLLNTPNSDDAIRDQIARKKLELNKVQRKIDNVIEAAKGEIEDAQRDCSRKFEDTISERLEGLVSGKSNDFDAEALSTINGVASLILSEYRDQVSKTLHVHAAKSTEDGIDMSTLSSIDVSSLSIKGLSYNLDLNSLGHEYDGYISTGVKVATAAAVVAATVATAGAAAGAAGTATAGAAGTAAAGTAEASAATIATATSVADTATDVGSMVVTSKLLSRLNKAEKVVSNVSKKYEMIENTEEKIQQKVTSKGLVSSIVGFFTDKAMGKPQRRRAIHNYMDDTLMPQFNSQLKHMTSVVVDSVRQSVMQGAESAMTEMTNAINSLREAQKKHEDEYQRRMATLRDYKNELAFNLNSK